MAGGGSHDRLSTDSSGPWYRFGVHAGWRIGWLGREGAGMTKKSNNRKFKLGETPMRYREVVLNVPMPMYERILKAEVKAIGMGLVDPKMPPRDYILVILANGVGMMEADLEARARKDSLVITPQEAAAMAERLRKAKAGG